MIDEDTDRVEVEVSQREKGKLKAESRTGIMLEKAEHHLAQQPLTLNHPPIALLYFLLLTHREDSSIETTQAKFVQQPPARHHGPVARLCPFVADGNSNHVPGAEEMQQGYKTAEDYGLTQKALSNFANEVMRKLDRKVVTNSEEIWRVEDLRS